MKLLRAFAVGSLLFASFTSSGATAPEATSAPKIVLGMSTALSGPAADLGLNMKLGVDTALAEANRAGGVHGALLELIALDDGYEPTRAGPNMHTLIETHHVLAIIGNVGTPTAVVAAPIAVENKTLFYGAFTGAGMLRKTPTERYIVNFRASYAEETGAMVDALVTTGNLKPQEIAFFTQRDAYGDAGFSGGTAALKRHGLVNDAAIVHGRYERNTVAVEDAVADLIAAEPAPRAVIMVGTYAPCAKFIQLAREMGSTAIFLNVSFVGANSLAKAAGTAGDGTIITQVVPHFSGTTPAAASFTSALSAFDPKATPSFGAFEGYLATRALLKAIAAAPGVPNRETLIDSLESLGTFDLGMGNELALSKETHQASHSVWPTIIRNGTIEPCDWSLLKDTPKADAEKH